MKIAAKLTSWMIVLGSACAWAADPMPATDNNIPPPARQGQTQGQTSPRTDNTDINQRDKSGMTPTPEKQTNRTQDRKLLAAVRRAVVHDKSLSSKAHNVKIMVQGGGVTLRGPVASEDEKAKVEQLAMGVKGVTQVDNRLDVKTARSE